MPNAAYTRQIAEWAAGLRYSDLPPEVVHQAKRLLLDYLAATITGATTEVSRGLRGYLEEVYPGDQATVVGGGRLSAPGAALANGTAAHGLEVDDGYTPGAAHPSAPTLPAVLAAAERHGASAEDTITAAAVAVELACRIAEAGHPASWRNGFHNTALAGVLAAAAGCASLLRASPEHTASALGLAGSHAGGLFEFLGSGAEVKRYHAGKAARDGLVSAELALRGVSGPATVLEGDHGYFNAVTQGDWNPEALMADLGESWRMMRTYVKPYPCCRHLHGPIDAALELRARYGLDLDEVTGVRVDTFAVAARHAHTAVADFLDAQMSIPFAVAVALADGEVGLEQFSPRSRGDSRILRVAEFVEVRQDEEHTRAYPTQRPARVEVQRSSGSAVSLQVDQPYGEPDNPMDDKALAEKFRRLCAPILGAERAEALIGAVWNFDSVAQVTRELGA